MVPVLRPVVNQHFQRDRLTSSGGSIRIIWQHSGAGTPWRGPIWSRRFGRMC